MRPDLNLRLAHYANMQRAGDVKKILLEAIEAVEEVQNLKLMWKDHNIAYQHLYTAYQEALFRNDPNEHKIVRYQTIKGQIDEWAAKKKVEIFNKITKQAKAEFREQHANAAKFSGLYWTPRFRGRRRLVLGSVASSVERINPPDSQEV